MGESYSCVSGGVIAAGRHHVQPTCALVGDSLTDPSYGLTPYYWGNGLNGGKLQLIANCGVSGNTVANVISRIGNSYTNASPGLAGLPPLGRVIVRIGTNDARNNTAIASLSASYTSLLNTLATYAQRVVILAVPPLAAAYIGQNPRTVEYNAWLAAFAAANPTVFKFIDDAVNVRDGSNAQITSYFSDGTHMNNAGVYQMGLDQAIGWSSELSAYPSPLSKDAADVYPDQPQWITNHVNAGTGGGKGSNVTGSVVNSVTVSVGGVSSAVCSIVAADSSDPNQTPWQRINPTSGSNGGTVSASFTPAGRPISSVDPSTLEAMIEVRFNDFDMSICANLKAFLQGNTGEYIVPKLSLLMGNASGQNKTCTLRHRLKRSGSTTPATVQALLMLTFGAAFASSIGSFDFRCFTVRG